MPYPVYHDTRNRLSAVPMIVSPLQTRGLELAFSPKRVKGAGGWSADKRDGSRSRSPGPPTAGGLGETEGDIVNCLIQ